MALNSQCTKERSNKLKKKKKKKKRKPVELEFIVTVEESDNTCGV